jgi:hypothetical protein
VGAIHSSPLADCVASPKCNGGDCNSRSALTFACHLTECLSTSVILPAGPLQCQGLVEPFHFTGSALRHERMLLREGKGRMPISLPERSYRKGKE